MTTLDVKSMSVPTATQTKQAMSNEEWQGIKEGCERVPHPKHGTPLRKCAGITDVMVVCGDYCRPFPSSIAPIEYLQFKDVAFGELPMEKYPPVDAHDVVQRRGMTLEEETMEYEGIKSLPSLHDVGSDTAPEVSGRYGHEKSRLTKNCHRHDGSSESTTVGGTFCGRTPVQKTFRPHFEWKLHDEVDGGKEARSDEGNSDRGFQLLHSDGDAIDDESDDSSGGSTVICFNHISFEPSPTTALGEGADKENISQTNARSRDNETFGGDCPGWPNMKHSPATQRSPPQLFVPLARPRVISEEIDIVDILSSSDEEEDTFCSRRPLQHTDCDDILYISEERMQQKSTIMKRLVLESSEDEHSEDELEIAATHSLAESDHARSQETQRSLPLTPAVAWELDDDDEANSDDDSHLVEYDEAAIDEEDASTSSGGSTVICFRHISFDASPTVESPWSNPRQSIDADHDSETNTQSNDGGNERDSCSQANTAFAAGQVSLPQNKMSFPPAHRFGISQESDTIEILSSSDEEDNVSSRGPMQRAPIRTGDDDRRDRRAAPKMRLVIESSEDESEVETKGSFSESDDESGCSPRGGASAGEESEEDDASINQLAKQTQAIIILGNDED